MKMSRRAKRMAKRHERSKAVAALNMISLMDIFTILVFFLLISSSSSEVLPNSKTIKLPESSATKRPDESLVVMVTRETILVQGKLVATIEQAMTGESEIILPLMEELEHHAERSSFSLPNEPAGISRPITIVADKVIPYALLKRIMVTSAQSSFGDISLAVTKKSHAKE